MRLDSLQLLPRFRGIPADWRGLAMPAAALGLVTFVLYALGACRTIYVGDSGELVTAAATLGIPHPTGYPLYVLLGKLWITLVPLGSAAFRMSLMSAFFGALAVAGLFGLCRRLALGVSASLFGALLLAFAPSFWSQATIQRVYTLNAFFAVLVTLLAVEWLRCRRLPFLVATAFAAGLGACNHTVIGVYGVAVGLVVLLAEPALLLKPKQLLTVVGAGLLGLLPYAYLPLRSRQEPRLDWGDPETLQGFLNVVSRRDFWGRAWIEKPSDWLVIVGDFVHSLGEETLWIGLALALVGGVAGWRRGWPVALAAAGMLANVWVMGVHGSRGDLFIWHRYYLLSYVLLAMLAACGLELLVERFRRARPFAGLALVVPAMMLALGWPLYDRSHYRIAEDFSRRLLESLPPGAHLAASDDNILFVLIYLQMVEGVRPDVDLILQGVGGADLPSLRFDPDTDPLYFTHHPNWQHPQIDVVPVGLVFRTIRRGSAVPPMVLQATSLDGEADPRVAKDYLTENLVGHFHYMLGVSMLGVSDEIRDWPRASAELRRAAEIARRNDVLFYNLGLIYRRNGLLERSRDAFARSVAINPRRLASDKPAQASEQLAEVHAELAQKTHLEAELASEPSLEGLEIGTAAWHREMSRLLVRHRHREWAVGHELQAQELQAQELPAAP